MTNAIVPAGQTRQLTPAQQRTDTIRRAIMDRLPALLPNGMSPQRFEAVTIQSIAKNPNLMDCDPQSVVMAVLEAAQIGLEPTGSLSRAWLIPFKGQATLMIGYMGLVDLARRSGQVSKVWSRAVYAGDQFEVRYGSDEGIVHVPLLETSDPTKVTHVYAIALLKDGSQVFEVMTRDQIEGVRARSRSANSGPWVTDWAEMGKKTVTRRLVKSLPLTAEVMDAIQRDDEREFSSPAQVEAPRAGSKTAQVRAAIAKRLSAGQPVQNDLQAAQEADQPNDALPAASAQQQPEQHVVAVSKPKAEKPVVKVTKPAPKPEPVEEEDPYEGVEVPADWQPAEEAARYAANLDRPAKPAKCGATSDPQLGDVLRCILLAGHQTIDKRPSPHEGPDGSKWPNR